MKKSWLSDQKYQQFGYRDDIPLMCLKFSDTEENIKNIKNGTMYMNSLDFFANLKPCNGMSDELEGGRIEADGKINYNKIFSCSHMLCFVGLNLEHFLVTKTDSKGCPQKIKIDSDRFDLSKMKEEFGEYFIPLWYDKLSDGFIKYCNQNKIVGKLRNVLYIDILRPENKKIMDEMFDSNDIDFCYMKREKFSNQQEIRMLLLDGRKSNTEAITIELGNEIAGFETGVNPTDLLTHGLIVTYK
ncbi:hypothetical protein FOE41_14650 [Listeria monocytogenes]|nr:hypothetical protein [Listeria monocytogenes]ECH5295678.1 hypothetical protein [Listeria monocytogenes]ELA3345553.1 hypothetical protein [Listeria monocytogenes]